MTKSTLFLGTVVLTLVITFAFARAGPTRVRRQVIPPEFQNINVDDYLKRPHVVQFQIKCIIHNGHCDRLGKYLKIAIPDFLTTQCPSCTPDQRRQIGRLIAHIQENYKKDWAAGVKKFLDEHDISDAEVAKLKNEYGIKVDRDDTVTR